MNNHKAIHTNLSSTIARPTASKAYGSSIHLRLAEIMDPLIALLFALHMIFIILVLDIAMDYPLDAPGLR